LAGSAFLKKLAIPLGFLAAEEGVGLLSLPASLEAGFRLPAACFFDLGRGVLLALAFLAFGVVKGREFDVLMPSVAADGRTIAVASNRG
jgi:hypothetical protein